MSESTPTTPQSPADLLHALIVTLLTPMFLTTAGGDLALARLAAIGTLGAYRAETQTDLITVAKIIAFGLAALGSLCLSMADDLPVQTVLRLRASANASDRAEHRNRRLLDRPEVKQPAPLPRPEPPIDHAALTATAVETQKRTAENLAKLTQPAPAPSAQPRIGEKQYQATWAACTAAIAAETAASIPNLPPEERQSAALWAEVLNDVSNSLLTDGLPPRPRPGDLAAVMRGA